jgi:hypothetical protein
MRVETTNISQIALCSKRADTAAFQISHRRHSATCLLEKRRQPRRLQGRDFDAFLYLLVSYDGARRQSELVLSFVRPELMGSVKL